MASSHSLFSGGVFPSLRLSGEERIFLFGEFLPFFKGHGATETGGVFVAEDDGGGSVDAFEDPLVMGGNVTAHEVKIANHVRGRNDQAVALSDERLHIFVGGNDGQSLG